MLVKCRASRRPPRRASPRPQDAPNESSGRRLHGRSPSLRLVGTLAHRVAVQAPHPRPRTGTTGVPGGPPRGGDRSQSASLDTLVGLCACVHSKRTPERAVRARAGVRRPPRTVAPPGAGLGPARPPVAHPRTRGGPLSAGQTRAAPAGEPSPASGPVHAYACARAPDAGAARGGCPLHTAGGVSRVDVWGGGSGFSEGKGRDAPWGRNRSGTAGE